MAHGIGNNCTGTLAESACNLVKKLFNHLIARPDSDVMRPRHFQLMMAIRGSIAFVAAKRDGCFGSYARFPW